MDNGPTLPSGPSELFDPARHLVAGAGETGVITSRAGVGKTACLTQFALAELLSGGTALHVTLDSTVSEVRGWYDRLLTEAGQRGLADHSHTARLDLERRRHIHSYPQQKFGAVGLSEALTFLKNEMDFVPRTVVVDGFPFERAPTEALKDMAKVAHERQISLWMTALTHREATLDPVTGLPPPLPPFAETLHTVLQLIPVDRSITLQLLRHRELEAPQTLNANLDPNSMLLYGHSTGGRSHLK